MPARAAPLMQAMTRAPAIPVAVTPGGPFGTMLRPWRVRFGPAVALDEPHEARRPARCGASREAVRASGQRLLAAKATLTAGWPAGPPRAARVVDRFLAEVRRGSPKFAEPEYLPARQPENSGWARRSRAGSSDTDGTKIAYQTWVVGDHAVPPHPGTRHGRPGWALQRGSFGRRHRCVAPDNRGTGGSDVPDGPYDLLRMAEDAIEVLDAEGIDRAHVVGASMGGVLAQIIGVLHPERVISLTLAVHCVSPPRVAPGAP